MPPRLNSVSETDSGYVFTGRKRTRLVAVCDGQTCHDKAVLERIRTLVIPPQWNKVWVSEDENAYLQATGRDAKGRKQYIYHPIYVAYRQATKFDKFTDFATALPKLRAEVQRQLRRRNWDRDRMLALMVYLMDRTKIRVGNACYEAENKTYGLTTLKREHLKLQQGGLAISFLGKSSKFHHIAIDDKRLHRLLQEVTELPGRRLFSYRCEAGKSHEIDSSDLNEYLHQHLGDGFSAKDFRTWGGSSLAVKFYPEILAEFEATGKGKIDRPLVKAVAATLGNTPTVCREYYIHPLILEKVIAGELPTKPWEEAGSLIELADFEIYTLNLLRDLPGAPSA